MFELRWLEYHVPIGGTNYGRREKKLQYRQRDPSSFDICFANPEDAMTPWTDVPTVKELTVD